MLPAVTEIFQSQNDMEHIVRVSIRLGVATVLGGLIGFERQYEHKSAGLRTHMLVSLGAALFTVIPLEFNMASGDVSRVMQGIAAGIGFLGAGMIFKATEQKDVKGLTSAAGIWVTAAIGVAAGAGLLWPAIIAVLIAWFILLVLHQIERLLRQYRRVNGVSHEAEKPGAAKSS
jgi:putative Mg2+ transporter-C (MgtC) family protein